MIDEDALEREERARSRAVLAGAAVAPLWPVADVGAPRLAASSGDERRASALTLSDGTLEVEVRDGRGEMLDEPERRVRDLHERRLSWRLGRRAAGRAVVEAELLGLPSSLDGRPETFALVVAGGAWSAVWRDQRRQLEITVTGAGEPPPRLDLAPATI